MKKFLKMLALADGNNFYVSCHRVFNPSLIGKPVVVLSNNDGCAISRSDEAKLIGVEMGAVPHLMPDNIRKQLTMFSSTYTLYHDMSDRMMKTLGSFVPRMEIYSIDEAFLDMTNIKCDDFHALGLTIRTTVLENTGLPTCIGLAPTKVLAKMANRYAKKRFKSSGVFTADSEEKIREMLEFTKVGEVWGIGKQYADMLEENGIFTAASFADMPEDFVRSKMSVVGLRIQKELKCIPCIDWTFEPRKKKVTGTSRCFGTMVKDKVIIREALSNYAANCALKLRSQKCVAASIKVFIHTNPYRKQDEQYYQSIVINMPRATSNTPEIIKNSIRGLDLIFKPGLNYTKCGVELGSIVPETEVQLDLFAKSGQDKMNGAIKVLDKINAAFGRDLVRFSGQGKGQSYKPRAEHLSPLFTTKLSDIIKIK